MFDKMVSENVIDIIDLNFDFNIDTHIMYKQLLLERIRKDKLNYITSL